MQVTGSSNLLSKSMSILIRRGGLSFYDSYSGALSEIELGATNFLEQVIDSIDYAISVDSGYDAINIIPVTERMVMIPQELFDNTKCDLYLRSKDISCNDRDDSVIISIYNKIAYITVIERPLVDFLQYRFGNNVSFTHPLLLSSLCYNKVRDRVSSPVMVVDHIYNKLALSLHLGTKMLFCEFFTISTSLDILFYIKRAIKDCGLNECMVLVVGAQSESLYNGLKEYIEDIDKLPISEYFRIQ